MRRLILPVVVLFVAACGSGGGTQRPKNVPQPEIGVGLTSSVFFGSGSTAPAPVEVRVRNRATVPIEIRRVELSSPGMVSYGIVPIYRDFREVIPPGEMRAVTVFAEARTTVQRPTEPLTIRAIIDFEAAGVRWREIVTSQG